MHINEVSRQIVDSAIRVHIGLGPGLLERAYQVCLAHELRKRGLRVRTEVPMPVVYDGLDLGPVYRIDILVEAVVVVEIKAIARVLPVHEAQLLSQLRLSGLPLGLLINFNVSRLKDGISRRANGYAAFR